MKVLILACLLLVAFCDEIRYYRYLGTLQVNNDAPEVITGPIFLEFLKVRNYTAIAGLYAKGRDEISFDFRANNYRFVNGNNIIIESNCADGNWGLKPIPVEGKVKVTGTWSNINYDGYCYSKDLKLNWTIHSTGSSVKCPFYTPAEGAVKVMALVGQKAEAYQPVNVVNYATTGFSYIYGATNCGWYLNNTKTSNSPKPGFLIVGNKGEHCAVIDRDGDKFVHSNPAKKQVTLTPMSMIKEFFKNGYVFKDYTC